MTLAGKKLAKQPDLESFVITESLDQSALPTCLDVPLPDSHNFDGREAVASVNRCLLEFGETPLSAAMKDSKQIERKMDKLTEAMKELMLEESPDNTW